MSDAPLVDHLGPTDPIEAVARFLDLPYLLFLDSATGPALAGEGHQLGRYSFLAADPWRVVRSKGRATELGAPGQPWSRVDADPLAVVRDLLAPWTAEPVFGLPPFQGGAAGFVGYDYGAVLERLPAPEVRRPRDPGRDPGAVRLGDRLGPPPRDSVDRVDGPAGNGSGPGRPRPGRDSRWCASGSAGRAWRPAGSRRHGRPRQ